MYEYIGPLMDCVWSDILTNRPKFHICIYNDEGFHSYEQMLQVSYHNNNDLCSWEGAACWTNKQTEPSQETTKLYKICDVCISAQLSSLSCLSVCPFLSSVSAACSLFDIILTMVVMVTHHFIHNVSLNWDFFTQIYKHTLWLTAPLHWTQRRKCLIGFNDQYNI